MGKKSKMAIGIVALAGLGSVVALSASKREQQGGRSSHRGRAEARPDRVGHRERTSAAADEGRRRLRRQRQDHQARRQRRPDGEGRATSCCRSIRRRHRRPSSTPRRRWRRAARSSTQAQANLEQAQKSFDRSAAIKKANPQLISDEQIEQLKTAVDVNSGARRRGQARRRPGDRVGQRRQELARQDDDLRADVRPGHAPRRRAG